MTQGRQNYARVVSSENLCGKAVRIAEATTVSRPIPVIAPSRPFASLPGGSRKPNRPAAELNAVKPRAPTLAGRDRKGAGQGAGGDDVATAREQADEMAQR